MNNLLVLVLVIFSILLISYLLSIMYEYRNEQLDLELERKREAKMAKEKLQMLQDNERRAIMYKKINDEEQQERDKEYYDSVNRNTLNRRLGNKIRHINSYFNYVDAYNENQLVNDILHKKNTTGSPYYKDFINKIANLNITKPEDLDQLKNTDKATFDFLNEYAVIFEMEYD